MNSRLPAAAVIILTTAGCTPIDTTLGGAVRHNIAVQVVDPNPRYEGEVMEGGDGLRGAKAVERYRKGDVKQPAAMSTTVGSSGGGGSRGGGSTSSGG